MQTTSLLDQSHKASLVLTIRGLRGASGRRGRVAACDI